MFNGCACALCGLRQEGWRPAVFSNMPQFGGLVKPDNDLFVSHLSHHIMLTTCYVYLCLRVYSEYVIICVPVYVW